MPKPLIAFFGTLLLLTGLVSLSSQAAEPQVLVTIEPTTAEQIAAARDLGVVAYQRWERLLLGTIPEKNLPLLRAAGLPVTVLEPQPWSGTYTLVTPRRESTRKAADVAQYGEVLTTFGPGALVKNLGPEPEAELRENFHLVAVTPDPIPLELPTLVAPNPAYFAGATLLDSLVSLVSTESLSTYDNRLVAFQTRYSFADSNYRARDWLVQKFHDFGYTDVVVDTFYYQGRFLNNIICTKPGTAEPDAIVVVGGHFDSVVYGAGDPMIFAPGADDDGTGTVGTLELARVLAQTPLRKTIKFITFNTEEQGLIGSNAVASRFRGQGKDVRLMVNMDMIAYVTDTIPDFDIEMTNQWASFAQLLAAAARTFTPLIPYFTTAAANSDHWPFIQYGYPAVFASEGDFNQPNWHQPTDLPGKLYFPYARDVVKAVLATMYAVSEFPAGVTNLRAADLGTGDALEVRWNHSRDSLNVQGYKICWGTVSGILDSSKVVSGTTTVDTIRGLTDGQTYFISVTPLPFFTSLTSCVGPQVQAAPHRAPLAPVGIRAAPGWHSATVAWNANHEVDLTGYRLYRFTGAGDTLVIPRGLPETTYVDNSMQPATRYFYQVAAVDQDGNESPLSGIVSAIPVTLDQGVLYVDETGSISPNPTEPEQATFYQQVLSGFSSVYHSVLGNDSTLPTLDLLGQYSTVIWLDDDPQSHLANLSLPALRRYLEFGGHLFWAGWRSSVALIGSATYPFTFTPGSVAYDLLHLRSVNEKTGFPIPKDFLGATGMNGFPDAILDTAKVRRFMGTVNDRLYLMDVLGYDLANAQAVARYRSASGDTAFDGKPCGVYFPGSVTQQFKTIYLAFPLYYLTETSARSIFLWAMQQFGEPGATCALAGDVDGDGFRTITDVVALVNYVVFGDPLPTGEVCADVTVEGTIDLIDIICLLNHVVFQTPVPCG